MTGNSKAGSAALIFGWLAYIGLMAVHPTHLGGPSLGHVDLNDAVHWTALMAMPVLACGYVGMARRLDLNTPLPLLGLCFMIFSLFAGMGAGIMNGLVMPEVMRSAAEQETSPDSLEALRHLVWWTNQGFAAIHYALAAVGTGLFGLAWMRQPGGRGLGIAGVAVAAGFLVWLATGLWRPDVHGALIVVLAIGAWSISAGFAMRREAPQA